MVCDVGTDHAYLPVFLYKSGICKSICATDIREKPLKNAKRNLDNAGINDIELYLCDGLDRISRDMADTVIIAGMGGEIISGIIDRADFLRDYTVTLILQPTTSAYKLRNYLAENGFVVVFERAVEDNGKLYAVMKAHYCGKPYPIDEVRSMIGLITDDYDDGRAYIQKQYNILKRKTDELKNSGRISNSNTLLKLEKILNGEGKHGV